MKLILPTLIAVCFFVSCNNKSGEDKKMAGIAIKEESVFYTGDSANMTGYVAYDSSSNAKRPIVLVVHEWWGLNDYAKMRARELAELGYLAFAVDIYGDRKMGPTPDSAGKLATPFYEHPEKAKARIDAALEKIKAYPQADTSKIAGIGYCFGGGLLLNVARMGEPFKGVVSFHGSLVGTPAIKDLLTAQILVCHGEADEFVKPEEVSTFKKQMDSIGAKYTFKSYPNATHAFTNPEATALGEKFKMPIRYNAAADSASWKDMKEFFGKIF
jgi:dienelactone hydrolase